MKHLNLYSAAKAVAVCVAFAATSGAALADEFKVAIVLPGVITC